MEQCVRDCTRAAHAFPVRVHPSFQGCEPATFYQHYIPIKVQLYRIYDINATSLNGSKIIQYMKLTMFVAPSLTGL